MRLLVLPSGPDAAPSVLQPDELKLLSDAKLDNDAVVYWVQRIGAPPPPPPPTPAPCLLSAICCRCYIVAAIRALPLSPGLGPLVMPGFAIINGGRVASNRSQSVSGSLAIPLRLM